MKKILNIILAIVLIAFIYIYRSNIYSFYVDYFVPLESKISTLENNDYSLSNNYDYVQLTDNFIPSESQDILNIYYTVINSGMETFTFYCPSEYEECTNDVNDLAKNQSKLSNLNNFVHPYNSFKKINTEVDTSGKVTINIEKVYSSDNIIIINYKIDEIYNKIITNTDSTKTKIKKIHDYIINNTSYDKDRADNKIVKYSSDNAYGVLIEGYGLCGGYTDAMTLFLYKINVENFKISTSNHVWNYLKVDNTWYHLDLTWDDPITTNNSQKLVYDYYLLSTKELLNKKDNEHIYDQTIYKK